MKLNLVLKVFLLALFLRQTTPVGSYKILAVFAFPGKSHFMMTKALISELVKSGHEVTMITSFTLASEKLGSNFTEILIDPVYDFWNDIKQFFAADNLFELTSMGAIDYFKMLKIIGMKTTEHALNQTKVQAIINAEQTEGVYDLLLVEQFYQEAFLALAYKYNVPIVSSSTLGYENHMSQMMGIMTPWSYVPHGFMPYTDNMNFMQRLLNSFTSLYEDLYREFSYFPQMDKLVQKHFSHLPVQIPKVSKMERNISVMLLNSHTPLTTARPSSSGMVAIGGLHIYPPKPLPEDIQTFLDDAVHGAIFFSLGSNVQSKDMPLDKLQIFLDVFASLKQRVVWKFENESIQHLPKNVMIKKWLPQSDILAHRNVKVFITHGGLFGTQEGVYHAVPILGIPFYCDQLLNINKAVQGGYGISLHFQDITGDILKNALTSLIHNSTYKDSMDRVSNIFRDRPMDARQTAIYWIEYVIKHKGASHLRSAGLNLKWYQFYLLDVIGLTLAVLLSVVLVLLAVVRFLFGYKTKSATNKLKLHTN